jgi:hypothetical protein
MGRAVHLLFLEYEIMKTITLGRARYTVRDDRHTFMSDILKLTGKHKPVKSKGAERRLYPEHGATLSTAAYVAWFYAINKMTATGFYEGLSDRLSVPQGEDSLEVEA